MSTGLDRYRRPSSFSFSSTFAAYNRLVSLSQRVGSGFADIDVQLKQRHE